MKSPVSFLVIGLVLCATVTARAQSPAPSYVLPRPAHPGSRTTLYDVHANRDPRGNLDYSAAARTQGATAHAAATPPPAPASGIDLISTIAPNAGRPWENLPSGMYSQSISPLVSDPLSRQ